MGLAWLLKLDDGCGQCNTQGFLVGVHISRKCFLKKEKGIIRLQIGLILFLFNFINSTFYILYIFIFNIVLGDGFWGEV